MAEPRPDSAASLRTLLDPEGNYVARLGRDAAALRQLAADLGNLSGSRRKTRLTKIERVAHQLAGSAGTFGFTEVGEAAIALEDGIIDARIAAVTPPADLPLLVERLLAALAAAVRAG